MTNPSDNESQESTIPMARPAGVEGLPVARAVGDVELTASNPMLLPGYTMRKVLIELSIFGVMAICFLFVVMNVISLLRMEDNSMALIGGTMLCGVLCALSILLIHLVSKNPLAGSGLTIKNFWLDGALALPGMIASFVLLMVVTVGLLAVVPSLADDMGKNRGKLLEHIPDLGLAGLLGIAILGSFYEEVIFRGFILPRVRVLTKSWIPAVLITSAAFAAMHVGGQEVVMTIPLFFVAVLWSVLTIWRKSITIAVCTHILFNFTQFLFLFGYVGQEPETFLPK